MSERPEFRPVDTSIPFYDRTPNNRATRACTVKFVDSVGTHLICPRSACKREGGCADRDMRALPFCWNHYRGMLRFLLLVAAKRLGADPRGSAAGEEPTMPEAFRGEPLLARWAAAGIPIDTLARPAEDGPESWDWESIPELRDRFQEMTDGRSAAGSREDLGY